jgi:hypothetical protein
MAAQTIEKPRPLLTQATERVQQRPERVAELRLGCTPARPVGKYCQIETVQGYAGEYQEGSLAFSLCQVTFKFGAFP